MKKTRGKDIIKMAAVSALAIGAFSAALIGANSLAFAAAASGTQAIPIATETIIITPNLPSESFQAPNLTILESPSLNEHTNNTVSAHAMPMEEAAQIGAQYIWDVFGESIDGMYVEMLFAAWPSQSRTYWIGRVAGSSEALDAVNHARAVNHDRSEMDAAQGTYDTLVKSDILITMESEQYRFIIDAVTGIRIDISTGFSAVISSPRDIEAMMEWRMLLLELGWNDITDVHERIEHVGGVSPEALEAYTQTAKGFAERHFSSSAVVDVSLIDIFIMPGSGNTISVLEAFIFTATDDTGREATIRIPVQSAEQRAVSITTQHNDLIPGFSYDRPGIG
ncbi:MAG: hypothetical protein FWE19_02945 [Oscillospiraceae bacterium]|nr:hypothetical protein [Oscillospiraceae bacterium]